MLRRQIITKLKWTEVVKRPSFLKKYRWRPKYLFRVEKYKKYVAVEVIYNEKYSNKKNIIIVNISETPLDHKPLS
jgi:hypothetical protein